MSFHNKPLDDLIAEDIDALVGQDETGQLDFKLELPRGTEQDKLEFVTDVCSMWRRGGDFVFGIRDEEGVAVEVVGLAAVDLDAAKRTLDQLIESRVERRLPNVQFGTVEHPTGPILVMRIAKSWQGPHGVRVGDGYRFPVRGASARKTYLDFEQLRSEFAGGEELRERVRAFRERRVAAILMGDTPIPMRDAPKAITHVVPVSAWLEGREIDPRQMHNHEAFKPLPRGVRGSEEHPNLEGFITIHRPRDPEGARNYLQSFRDGTFERVTTDLFQYVHAEGSWPEKRTFGDWFEDELIHGVKQVIDLLRQVEVTPPIVVLATVANAEGWIILSRDHFANRERSRLATDVVRLPDIVINDFAADLPRALRPIIDTFWQAGGGWGSPYYDNDGNWQGSELP